MIYLKEKRLIYFMKSSIDKIYILLAIASLIASWIPEINSSYRIALLISFMILLIIIYYSRYFKISDKIENDIKELGRRVDKIEDLINIQSDIKFIKDKLKIK